MQKIKMVINSGHTQLAYTSWPGNMLTNPTHEQKTTGSTINDETVGSKAVLSHRYRQRNSTKGKVVLMKTHLRGSHVINGSLLCKALLCAVAYHDFVSFCWLSGGMVR